MNQPLPPTQPPEDRTEAFAGTDGNTMLLLFCLSDEIFGLSVSCISEIIDLIPQTAVPNADPFAPAIINVRGAIVPLLDIRRRLRIPQTAQHPDTRVVVLEMVLAGQQMKLALIADSVTEVIATDMSSMEMIPELGARWPRQYVRGIARHNDKLVVLLDTENLFQAKPDLQQTA